MGKLIIDKFIICDDIRQETSGKLILIGVYPDDIIVVKNEFPYIHKSLSFFIMLHVDSVTNEEVKFTVVDPKGENVFDPNAIIELKNNKFSINASISNLRIESAGEYMINIYVDNILDASLPFNVIQQLPESNKSITTG